MNVLNEKKVNKYLKFYLTIKNCCPVSLLTLSRAQKKNYSKGAMPKSLQSHFVTTQHFHKMLLSQSPSLSLYLPVLKSFMNQKKKRHKKTINYKNQLPSELNQITNCKNIASKQQSTLLYWSSIFKKNWRIYVLCDCNRFQMRRSEKMENGKRADKFITYWL